jgi:hypothetical protein
MGRKWGKQGILWMTILAGLLFPLPATAVQTLQIVLEDSGTIYWETPIPDNGSFILRHCNSIYDAWVEERFQTDSLGRIRLTAVKTRSPAVLEYYGLETVSTDWIPIPRLLERLSLLVSSRGRVSLFFDQRRIPLSAVLPDGTRTEVRVVSGNK